MSERRSYRLRRGRGSTEEIPFKLCGWKVETFKATTLLLGLLSFLLLAGVIVQSLIFQKAITRNDGRMRSIREEMITAVIAKEEAEALSHHFHKQYNDTMKLVKEIQADVVNLTEEVETLKAAILHLERNNTGLMEVIKQLEKELESCENCESIKALYNKTLEKYLQLQQDYKNLNKEMEDLQANHTGCESLVAEQVSTIRTLRGQLDQCSHRTQDLERRLKTSLEMNDNLTVINQNLVEGTEKCLNDCKVLLEENEDLKKQLEMAHREIRTLQNSVELLRQENRKLQGNLTETTTERDELKEENKKLNVQIKQLQEDVNRLNETIESMRDPCGENWTRFQNFCYHVSAFPVDWYISREYCARNGAFLFMSKTRAESEFVGNIHCYSVWMGLNNFDEDEYWEWPDGTVVTEGFWAEGKPTDNYECAEAWHNRNRHGLWNDKSCHDKLHCVCQRPLPRRTLI